MAKNKNSDFEHTLEDILKPEDPDATMSASESDNTAKKRIKPASATPQNSERNYPKWVDAIVRIFPAVINGA